MQTCLLALGILLAGQVGDSSGTRYSVLPPTIPANARPVESAQPPAVQQPFSNQTQATPPPTTRLPAQEAASTGLTKIIKPAELLESLAKPVGREQLSGVPLSLGEAVQNARSRDEQTRRVALYWELSQVVVEYRLAAREEMEMQSLRDGLGQAGQAWEPVQQAVAARKQAARGAVEVAQLRFQKELRRAAGENNLPLPSNLPHCGAYETKFQQIFQGRTSREAEQLSRLLPLRHKDLGQRAVDSTNAREQLILVSRQRSPQSDSTQLLRSYEQLALQRQTFVATAYQYNANIARYTELAVPQEIAAVRLVSMLIQTDGSADGDWQSGAIRRAAAEEAVPQNNRVGSHQPRTYAEPGRSETRRVPTGEAKGEHSILVSPQQAGQ